MARKINETPGELVYVEFKAWRQSLPEQKVHRQLEIVVNSKNEHKPTFESSYTTSINENLPYGIYVIKVFASDKDYGSTGKLLYALVKNVLLNLIQIFDEKKISLKITRFNRIVGGNKENWFQIDQRSGVITTTQNKAIYKPFESNIVTLVVEARDQSRFPKSTNTTVKVFINDVNDKAPKFIGDSFEIVLQQDVQPFTSVFDLVVEDYDSGSGGEINLSIDAVISYPESITYSGNCQQIFSLSSNHTSLVLLKSFEDLKSKRYEVVIRAKDRGIPSLSSKKTIAIKKVKKEAQTTVFKFYPEVYYVKLSQNLKTSQVIQTKIRYEYLFHPKFFIAQENENYLRECFDININTGLLTLKSLPLIKENKLNKLKIEAFDKFNNVANATIVLFFYNNSFTDAFYKKSYKLLIKENNTNFNTRVLTAFTAHSFFIDTEIPDENITKCIIQSGDVDKSFRITAKSNGLFELQAHRSLDRESLPFHNLTIMCETSSEMTGYVDNFKEVNVQINVTDINDNWPIFNSSLVKYCNMINFTKMFKAEVDLFLPIAHAKLDDFVFNSVAVDDDAGFNSKVVYSIMDPRDWFNINTETGVIRVNSQFETKSREFVHEVKVVACDKGVPMRCSILSLQINLVKNIGDFLPKKLTFGNVVLADQFFVFDCLSAIKLPFQTSTDKTNKNVKATFKVMDKRFKVFPDGKIYKSADYTFSKTVELSITVKLEDSFTNAYSKISFTAESLLKENFETNEYFKFNVSLPVRRGDVIGNIIAKETSFNTPLRYYFCQDLNGTKISKKIKALAIDTLTGKLSFSVNVSTHNLLKHFDVNTQNLVVFKVCYGSATSKLVQLRSELRLNFLTCQEQIYIQQIDRFKTIKVYENSSIGTVVLGSFLESNAVANVKLLHSLGTNFPFQLNSRNEVITTSLLDREIKSFYEFQYVINLNKNNCRSYQNSHTVAVSLVVLDVNDFAPCFPIINKNFTVKRDAKAYSLIASVTANDYDEIGKLFYSLKSAYSNLFEIDSLTGNIFLIKSLLHETKSSFKLTVAVNDGIVFSYTNVTIKVEDVFDGNLKFANVYNCEITENIYVTKTKVCRINVLKDSWFNKRFTYEVLKQRSDDKVSVSINNKTGDVYIIGEVVYNKYRTKGYFVINVIAKTNQSTTGSPKFFTSVPIFVLPNKSTLHEVEMTSPTSVLVDKRNLVKNFYVYEFTWSGMSKNAVSLEMTDQLSKDLFTLRGNRLFSKVNLQLDKSRVIQVKVLASTGEIFLSLLSLH